MKNLVAKSNQVAKREDLKVGQKVWMFWGIEGNRDLGTYEVGEIISFWGDCFEIRCENKSRPTAICGINNLYTKLPTQS